GPGGRPRRPPHQPRTGGAAPPAGNDVDGRDRLGAVPFGQHRENPREEHLPQAAGRSAPRGGTPRPAASSAVIGAARVNSQISTVDAGRGANRGAHTARMMRQTIASDSLPVVRIPEPPDFSSAATVSRRVRRLDAPALWAGL